MGLYVGNHRDISSRDLDAYYKRLNDIINTPIGVVKSRDDIINPHEILHAEIYRNTKQGKKLYEDHLNTLLAIQAQQEASYQDWYNSAEQQALRERDAGLNPDLIGVDGSIESSTANSPSSSAMEGITSTEETALNVGSTVVAAIGTIVSSVATLGALPVTIAAAGASAVSAAKQAGLIGAQETAQQLANINAFEKSSYDALAANLADSVAASAKDGKPFDFDSWLSQDHSSVFVSYAPDGVTLDNPRYAASWSRVLQNIEKHKRGAYDISGAAVKSQSEFAQALSDPYFDKDLLTQMAYLEPVSEAMRKIEALTQQYELAKLNLSQTYVNGLDGDLAAQDFNARLNAQIAESGYKENYFENADGEANALYDLAMKKAEYFIKQGESIIKQNYLSIWQDKSKPYTQRASAQYMLMGNVPENWRKWLGVYMMSQGFTEDGSSVFNNDNLDSSASESIFKLGSSIYDLD